MITADDAVQLCLGKKSHRADIEAYLDQTIREAAQRNQTSTIVVVRSEETGLAHRTLTQAGFIVTPLYHTNAFRVEWRSKAAKRI